MEFRYLIKVVTKMRQNTWMKAERCGTKHINAAISFATAEEAQAWFDAGPRHPAIAEISIFPIRVIS